MLTVWPREIQITGNPAARGLADLSLVFDTNDVHNIRAVITADQLVDLHEQTSRKIAELPFKLVNEDGTNSSRVSHLRVS
jgi:hypothetical protein